MYKNLLAEMARVNINKVKLAELMKKSPKTIYNKLDGTTKVYVDEAIQIKNIVAPEQTIEYLFKEE